MKMKQVFHFKSFDQKQTITAYYWSVEKPKAIVQIVHGMAEFAERYEPFIRFLNQNGYAVFAHDHLGHGHSISNGNPYGYFTDYHPIKTIIEDTHFVTLVAKKTLPNIPIILFGHSMGSFIARNTEATYPSDFSGCIFMGTSGKRAELSLIMPIIQHLNHVAAKKVNHWLDQLTFGFYYLLYPNPQSRNDWLSSDRYEVSRYDESPKMGFTFTNNGFFTLFSLIMSCNSDKWYQTINHDIPYFILSGSKDPVGEFGKGPRQVERKMILSGCIDIALKLYHNDRHELLNEVNRQEVYSDILQWLQFHFS